MTRFPNIGYDWAVSIFSARETLPTLRRTLDSAVTACGNRNVIIDVLVNGNSELAGRVAAEIDDVCLGPSTTIRVWDFSIPDKAETWNQYLHEIWPGAKYSFFIDGYVAVAPEALTAIAAGLADNPRANCATGLPNNGWSSRKLREAMLEQHGVHGNLYALPQRIVEALRAMPFRLPQGIYRNDSTLGAVLAFSLDPAGHEWDPDRLLVMPEATWRLPPRRWWTWPAVKAQWKRRIRQAQGDFENSAIKQHLALERRSPASLPETARELVEGWVAACPKEATQLTNRSWRHRKALKQLLSKERWCLADHPAVLLKIIRNRSA